MDFQLNLPDRLCGQCMTTKGYLHFLPQGHSKTWCSTCAKCRSDTVREALPDLPFLPCSTCRKPRNLTAFVVVQDGEPSIGGTCYPCRLKSTKQARASEGEGEGG